MYKIYVFVIDRFPKDANICSLWKQICNLREDDNVSKLKICGSHFNETDFQNFNVLKYGGKLILKHDTVPSISVPCPMKLKEWSVTKGEQIISQSANEHQLKRQHQITGIYLFL